MKRAEDVVFGGSGLDRAASLRKDPEVLKALWQDPRSRVLPMWQGKPLCLRAAETPEDEAPDGLALLPVTHDMVVFEDMLFLGLSDAGGGYFAQNLNWTPAGDTLLEGFIDLSEQHHPDLPDTHVFAELRRIMTRLTPREAELAATARAVLSWHQSHGFCSACGAKSDMLEAGWQRRCPSCGTRHFPRTDPVVIMLITHGDKVLLGRSPGWPEGMYSLLAGFVEPGETLEAAVRREVLEEAGVTVGEVSYLASQPWAFPMSLMIGCAGVALTDEIKIDPLEIEDARWLTRQEMMASFAGAHPMVKPARKGAIAHFLLENWLADTLD
jgi:NAD+ diphosphatase